MKTFGISAAVAASLLVCGAFITQGISQEPMKVLKQKPAQAQKSVKKSEVEWEKELTPEQYRVLRKAGTEAPNGKIYKQFMSQGSGTYVCAACGAELFSSDHKFNSHCGWPSFYDPAKAKNVKMTTDYKLGMSRTEVTCAVCGSHLGHVFTGEGYDTPTDKRYCINGTSLKFVPDQKAKKK